MCVCTFLIIIIIIIIIMNNSNNNYLLLVNYFRVIFRIFGVICLVCDSTH